MPHGNPVSQSRLPKEPEDRKRRLNTGELELIKKRLKGNTLMLHAVILAIETAMRRSELCRIKYRDIDTLGSTLFIPETKNGLTRTIPLSKKARESLKVLTALQEQITPDTRLLPVQPQSITGHQDLRMLRRYTHIKAETLVDCLASITLSGLTTIRMAG